MSEQFISLKCSSCGAKLDVYPDMDRFACGYCGTELIAQRRGGTVALKAVTEAIKQVQIGTDKTAAELAIARYEKDLRAIQVEIAETREIDEKHTKRLFLGGLIVILGLIAIYTGQSPPGALMAIVGVVVALVAHEALRTSEIDNLRQQESQLQNKISEKRKIADT